MTPPSQHPNVIQRRMTIYIFHTFANTKYYSFIKFPNTEYYSFMKIYEYRILNTIRSGKFTNTKYRILFVTSKSTNTKYRIVLFGPSYSRIPNNRIIRCNSETYWHYEHSCPLGNLEKNCWSQIILHVPLLYYSYFTIVVSGVEIVTTPTQRQRNLNCSWVSYEKDSANHPTQTQQ